MHTQTNPHKACARPRFFYCPSFAQLPLLLLLVISLSHALFFPLFICFPVQSALFNFQSLLQVILLLICACAYARAFMPRFVDGLRHGPASLLWKFARIGATCDSTQSYNNKQTEHTNTCSPCIRFATLVSSKVKPCKHERTHCLSCSLACYLSFFLTRLSWLYRSSFLWSSFRLPLSLGLVN